jgi:acyl-CoA reductase-like NAD-dependent aldehyde dehydrogenase
MSGYGRELGWEAMADYTQVKNVYVELEDEILYLYD